MNTNINDRRYFEESLRSTGRKGIDAVIANLDRLGFFSAPASTIFHLNCEGGLLRHSVNVCREALALREKQIELSPGTENLLPVDSVLIASLLHDICKAEIYVPEEKNRKNERGYWEKYMGYGVDYSDFPVGHGEKSVIRLLQWGLEMTDEEILAIRWHMQAWDLPFQSPEIKNNLNAAKARTPLVALITAADGLASFILER
jgi:hypothetical protein